MKKFLVLAVLAIFVTGLLYSTACDKKKDIKLPDPPEPTTQTKAKEEVKQEKSKKIVETATEPIVEKSIVTEPVAQETANDYGNKDVSEMLETIETTAEPAYISYVEGMVEWNFEEAEIGVIIRPADILQTTNGRVEVCFNKNYIRLNRYTEIVFVAIEEEFISIRVNSGKVYLQIKDQVAVQTPREQDLLSAGLYLVEDGKIYSNPMIQWDFDRWNDRRMRELNRRASRRYLPSGLEDYEYTLSYYGYWKYSPYGYIWIPYPRYLRPGWKPYFYGRWVWNPYYGWSWISYDGPWGWCVFHYGRWHYDPFLGWYWIPTRTWGPAWVHWYYYGSYICWSPMWHDDNYYQRHRNYYDRTDKEAWTVVHKNQLKKKQDISKSVLEKRELQKNPKKIHKDQLKKKLDTQKVFTKEEYRERERRTIEKKTLQKSSEKRTIKKETPRKQEEKRIRKQEEPRREKEVRKKEIRKEEVRKKETEKKTEKPKAEEKKAEKKESKKVEKKKVEKKEAKKQPSKKSEKKTEKKSEKKVKKKKKE